MVSPIKAEAVLSRLDPDERRSIERFVLDVRQRLGPRLKDLRIFGSKVRGDDHDESDIDVLVLVDQATWDDVDTAWELAMSINPKIQPDVHDFERYHSSRSMATGFYKEMRKESVRL